MLNIQIKDHFRETRIFTNRLTVVVVVVAVMCTLLLARLLYLQVINHDHYVTLSLKNRINPAPIPPVRGTVYDRNGIVLAENFSVYSLEIIPEQVDDMEALLQRMGYLISLSDDDIADFRELLGQRARFESIPLRSHLSDEEAARVALQRPYLNGVELHARLQRHYPLGALGVHALGYVGNINDRELKKIDRRAYRGTQHIGKLGIEGTYEPVMLGKVGINKTEINAHGRVVRTVERIKPKAGANLHLNIDVRMQAIAEGALKGKRGAVVAIDPKTGAVLTFASMPTYNPNPFVNGIATPAFQVLLKDPDKPLINRALNGQYAPGSTIKPFLGLAAMASGLMSRNTVINCAGHFSLPGDKHIFRDWKRAGHGPMTIRQAMEQSCDVYFYRLAATLGIERMSDALSYFGFGIESGVDLRNESDGLVATPEWKQRRGEPWYPGETIMTGIGQGMVLVTPLQLASATAMLANKGVRLRPRVVRALEDAGTRTRRVYTPETIDRLPDKMLAQLPGIIRDMEEVVHGASGTGQRIKWGLPFRVAGKTGTAQVKSIAQGEYYDEKSTPERLRDHALFISFAPTDNPKIAIAVVVENGGHGSSAAAPIARQLIDYYLLDQSGS